MQAEGRRHALLEFDYQNCAWFYSETLVIKDSFPKQINKLGSIYCARRSGVVVAIRSGEDHDASTSFCPLHSVRGCSPSAGGGVSRGCDDCLGPESRAR